MGLISGVVTETARVTGHWISFGLTMVMMYGLAIYVYFHRRKRTQDKDHWHKWGPFYLTLAAAFLVNLDPSRHIFQDLEIWPAPGSSEYRPDCHEETFYCLSVVGWLFTVVFTYSGFIFLIIGTLWNADMKDKCKKISNQWKEMKEQIKSRRNDKSKSSNTALDQNLIDPEANKEGYTAV
ncbi:hypothetical protein WA158_002153 [Blastocystis sp. Blastoise]